jgi:hypothetical protein
VFSAQHGGLRTRTATPATVNGSTLQFSPGNDDFVPGEQVNVTVTTAVTATGGHAGRAKSISVCDGDRRFGAR